MTYFQRSRPASHIHRYFVDSNSGSGDLICLCGKLKEEKHGTGPKGSKYRNVPQEYNGITYHSTFEANYAAELNFRLKARDIMSWERQVKLPLDVNGYHICNYYIDFIIHHKDGTTEFVECKGFQTDVWKLKWKLLEAIMDKQVKDGTARLTIEQQRKGRVKPTIHSHS